MKNLIFCTLLLASSETFAHKFFVDLKLGYTVRESDTFELDDGRSFAADYGHPVRANISAGIKVERCKKYGLVCKVGIEHESSVLSGWPLNEDYEYTREGLFVRVGFEF